MLLLFTSGVAWILYSAFAVSKVEMRKYIKLLGVRVKRVRSAAREIERKSFHLTGLIVPLLYSTMLEHWNWRHRDCVIFFVSGTAFGWCFDIARLMFPVVRRNFPLGKILRDKEETQLCGACYFSLGVTLAIALFPPEIAMTSIVFLVLGDMSAALIGVSFGGEAVSLKLGREGKKSAEGSVAMFVICFFIGIAVFRAVPLSEYIAFVGAFMATVVELYEPFALNDNLTIPIFSSLAMTWALHRVEVLCDTLY